MVGGANGQNGQTAQDADQLTWLWHSNAPWFPTGYGNQTAAYAPRLARRDRVLISAFCGLEGSKLRWRNEIDVLPSLGGDQFGAEALEVHFDWQHADVVLSLLDVWVLPVETIQRLPWAAWCPVDSTPLPPAVAERLKAARWPIAMSQFGLETMRQAGIEATYIPHGVDSTEFRPVDRAKVREQFAKNIVHSQHERDDLMDEDTFLVVMVAANKGMPSRKAFPEVLTAWKLFHDQVPNSHLYLHTDEGGSNGADLHAIMALLGVDEDSVSFPPPYSYAMGGVMPAYLNDIYNAADVLLNPAHGEGFGIPIIEAQMAGCPVIVGDNSAQTELCLAGWTVKGAPVITPLNAWQFRPIETEIVAALTQAYEILGPEGAKCGTNLTMRSLARERALAYDAERVWEEHWVPFVERVRGEILVTRAVKDSIPAASLDDKRAARRTRYQMERQAWAKVGLFNEDGSLSIPGIDTDDELRVWSDGRREIIADGFKPVVHGIDLSGMEDDPTGPCWKLVVRELQQNAYGIEDIDFQDGDQVLDIGANVGVVSIYLALRYPQIGRIWAYEAMQANGERMQRNLVKFGVADRVQCSWAPVTSDGRWVVMADESQTNSGGSHIIEGGDGVERLSVAFSDVLALAERWAFMKMDCEGSEYEILSSVSDEQLAKMTHLGAEFHWMAGKPSPLRLAARIEAAGVTLVYTTSGHQVSEPEMEV